MIQSVKVSAKLNEFARRVRQRLVRHDKYFSLWGEKVLSIVE